MLAALLGNLARRVDGGAIPLPPIKPDRSERRPADAEIEEAPTQVKAAARKVAQIEARTGSILSPAQRLDVLGQFITPSIDDRRIIEVQFIMLADAYIAQARREARQRYERALMDDEDAILILMMA